ncbi:MAG TPA: hypothetical protein VF178_02550 [Gemmatimonadaceae bacterium]
MRRIIMLVMGAMALAACSNPTAPAARDESAESARAVLRIASKAPAKASPKLASN